MESKILKVVQQGEAFAVQSQKAEGGQVMKRTIVLQELGGKFENQYLATMLGELANMEFHCDDVVVASLKFSVREYNGNQFQDILVMEIQKLSS